ncbi:phospho-sugar mutase [Clostridium sp. HBUAS56010]|uniref:phospho-sugar mutase n=1 Tax=Clostridium sp. HBUAS56010 TaxID=2571127 RepID=UPI0011775332|nr:phospho-sugar mutase [Clostridium sp. HBUAS56010]
MEEKINRKWNQWRNHKLADVDLMKELDSIEQNESEIFDCFYRELEFGTGGLRGIIGVGTNRMNIYTVAKATQGYSNYLKKQMDSPSVAIAYDSRIKSDVFAKKAAEVFAANGIHVYIYQELMPTPSLSFAVRYLKCAGGIVITASHNPSKYNGYKVYGSDGCQITTEAASSILSEIEKLDIFNDVNSITFEEALLNGMISYIEEEVVVAFLDAVSGQALCGEEINKGVSIVYTPLNGSGLKCVTRVLKENGFTNIAVVPEQENPDGNFPTCPYPNPEMKEALELGLREAKKLGSDLLLATDPDCDRVGIAVLNKGEYVLLSGNEVGMLLLDYICKRRIATGKMPEDPVLVKTIVTIDMAGKIAQDYGVRVIDVLTGFKFIGEQIGRLEANGQEESFILGFEESYGYLTGGYVRDKDAVVGSLMICEMFAYYKTQGLSLIDVLTGLYKKYGYCLNTLHSYTFEGAEGFQKMQAIMHKLRQSPLEKIGTRTVIEVKDYQCGINNLPKSDVLKYLLEGDASVVIRPSGTEPKMKLYLSVSAENREDAERLENIMEQDFKQIFD